MRIICSIFAFLFFFVLSHYLVWFGNGNLEPSVDGAFTIALGSLMGVVAALATYIELK